MFKEICKNVVESDEGFSIKVLGRTGIEYAEGEKSMFVDSEILSGPHGMMVRKKSIIKWKGQNSEPVDDKKRDEIVENIRRAFLFWGFEIEIV